MIKIKRDDNIFECDEKQQTFNRLRYGIPMAHMNPFDSFLYLAFDSQEQEDVFCDDHSDIIIDRFEDDDVF